MVTVMGATFWGFTILVPEYCLGVWADASAMGTPSMGMLVILISALPALLLLPLIVIYLLQYLGRVLVSSAMGETVPPRTPDRNFDGLLSGLSPWLIWLIFGGLLGLSPLVLLAYLRDRPMTENPFLIVVCASLGLPYALTSLMLSFLHDRPWAAAPPGVLGTLLRHGFSLLPVLLQVSVILGLGGVAFVLASMLRASHFWVYLASGAGLLGTCDLDFPRRDAHPRAALPSKPGPVEMAACRPRWGVNWRL